MVAPSRDQCPHRTIFTLRVWRKISVLEKSICRKEGAPRRIGGVRGRSLNLKTLALRLNFQPYAESGNPVCEGLPFEPMIQSATVHPCSRIGFGDLCWSDWRDLLCVSFPWSEWSRPLPLADFFAIRIRLISWGYIYLYKMSITHAHQTRTISPQKKIIKHRYAF